MRRRQDGGAAAVVGAVVVLAVLGSAILYINAIHVPRQGTALEAQGAERTEAALLRLASVLSRPAEGAFTHEVPLRAPPAPPPLLDGIVLSPPRGDGSLALAPEGSRIQVSVVLDAPAGGVPPGDATRVDLGGGRMRHYLLGNATAGVPLGALSVATGGIHAEPVVHRLEGGALLAQRDTRSLAIAPPALEVERRAGETAVSWRIPLVAGSASETTGGDSAQVSFQPGPEARTVARAYAMEVRIETAQLAGWTAALQRATGTAAVVATGGTGTDAGTVVATLAGPDGGAARGLQVDLRVVRLVATL